MNRYWGRISLRSFCFSVALLVFLIAGREATAAQLTLSWGDASSNEDGFKLERKTGTTGTYAQIATAAMNTTTYLDSTLSNSTAYCYHVRAYNTAGNSAYGNEACGTTATPDSQFPTSSLTAPTSGATVSGTAVTVSANASDNVGVVGVQFLMDGNTLSSEDTTSPYSISWNTTTVANGAHTLAARARDAAGNQTISTTVTVTVSNTAPPSSFTLTITKAGSGNGTISSSPAGISCGSDCTEAYPIGTVVTLAATPAAGSTFTGWSGTTCSGTGNCMLTLAANAAVTATFIPLSGTLTEEWGNTPTSHHPNTVADTFLNLDANNNSQDTRLNTYTWPTNQIANTILMRWNLADIPPGSTIHNATLYLSLQGYEGDGGDIDYAISVHQLTTKDPIITQATGYTADGATAWTANSCCLNNVPLAQADIAIAESVQVINKTLGYRTWTVTQMVQAWVSTPAANRGLLLNSDSVATADSNRYFSSSEYEQAGQRPKLLITYTPPSVQETFALTVNTVGTGSGTVTGTGINCGADCTETYSNGTVVTLTPTPAAGSTFAGWSGDTDCSDSSITMSAAKTCTATFTAQTYTLMVTKTGTGSGTVSATGISCGSDCSEAYASGTVVALTATPAAGSTFVSWSGNADCTDASVTMSAATTCTATFNLVPPTTYSLTVTKAGSGSGTVSATGINCGSDCSEAYASGTVVALTATPAAGSTFTGWSGAADCSDGSVTMSAATTCTATFTRPLQVQIGTFRPSAATWYLDLNSNGVFDGCTVDACSATFGISTDRPIVGDWTGIGTIQLGTFDPTTQMWELDRNGNDRWEDCTIDLCRGPFGQSSDLPVAGYWKAGMTTAGIGTYRPSTGKWYLDLNGNGKLDKGTTDARLGPFGTATDKPVVGNWAGNGITRIGVFTPSTGNWQLDLNGNGTFDGCTTDSCRGPFGTTGDLPVAGDWTGTGRTQIGVFTPASGQWKLDTNGNGVFDGCTVDACFGSFGQTGDIPVVGKW